MLIRKKIMLDLCLRVIIVFVFIIFSHNTEWFPYKDLHYNNNNYMLDFTQTLPVKVRPLECSEQTGEKLSTRHWALFGNAYSACPKMDLYGRHGSASLF